MEQHMLLTVGRWLGGSMRGGGPTLFEGLQLECVWTVRDGRTVDGCIHTRELEEEYARGLSPGGELADEG